VEVAEVGVGLRTSGKFREKNTLHKLFQLIKFIQMLTQTGKVNVAQKV
jgi:hypothetical protein